MILEIAEKKKGFEKINVIINSKILYYSQLEMFNISMYILNENYILLTNL